jgi:alpha-galactosidase
VQRQEWGAFRVGRAITETPLRIGDRTFARGLGTHAPSEVLVRLPGPGRSFSAAVGVDNNPITYGQLGSAAFRVLVAGEARYESPVLRGGDAAREVQLDLGGAQELVLATDETEDGPHSDVVDWAEAHVTLEGGREVWLDELPLLRGPVQPATRSPFSFTYGGQSSRDFLAGWPREATHETGDSASRHTLTWRAPDSRLIVTCTAKAFDDFPAVEWVMEFENRGEADSEVLEAVLPLDLSLGLPPGEHTRLCHTRGSLCAIDDFLPAEEQLRAGDVHEFAPLGGRSSNGTLPFFEVDWSTGGVLVAIGWSGQWAASLGRPDLRELRLTAGQPALRARLHPGEKLRAPRVLLLFWEGREGEQPHNLFRRLMLTHYCPRVEGALVLPPIAHPTAWSILASGAPANEANQREMLAAAAGVGAEAFWLDAYWFPKGFPGGVGTWTPRPEDFPRGLRPLSDAAHERDMQFVLWFEPERVARASHIAQEHPEFCLESGEGDLLYSLADPAALRYITDLLSGALSEHGVDVYREDFNIDPLPFWEAADEPDRRGVIENHWVTGLYAMWDELAARRPGLVIDNCASGGRRIDLETVSRSYALWRSDFQDVGILSQPDPVGPHAIASQVQTVGLSRYVPFSTNSLYRFDPYAVRSALCGAAQLYMDLRRPEIDRDQARAAVAEMKALRPYFLGDLYPLTEVTTSPRDWCAYQLDRPEQGDGIALYFRRHESPYLALEARLQALDAEATYEYSLAPDYASPPVQRATGRGLVRLPIRLDEAPGSLLLRYRRLG